MRVIAGTAKGRRLKGPGRSGRGGSSGTRPTSDLVRGALFSALEAAGTSFERVLDLYAGTGALGIEALSRGATQCDFVERDPSSAAIIRENLRLTGFEMQARLHAMNVFRALQSLSGVYSLVIADPPYDDRTAYDVLESVIEAGLARGGETTIALEFRARDDSPAVIGPFERGKVLRHGETAVAIYR